MWQLLRASGIYCTMSGITSFLTLHYLPESTTQLTNLNHKPLPTSELHFLSFISPLLHAKKGFLFSSTFIHALLLSQLGLWIINTHIVIEIKRATTLWITAAVILAKHWVGCSSLGDPSAPPNADHCLPERPPGMAVPSGNYLDVCHSLAPLPSWDWGKSPSWAVANQGPHLWFLCGDFSPARAYNPSLPAAQEPVGSIPIP